MTSYEKTKWCFPFFHKWSWWRFYAKKTLKYRVPIHTYIETTTENVKERNCIRCGKIQKREVKISI